MLLTAVEACITRAHRHLRCHQANEQVFFFSCAARPEGIDQREKRWYLLRYERHAGIRERSGEITVMSAHDAA